MKSLIVGCGYVGRAVAMELIRRRHQVCGVRRSEAGRAEMEEAGIIPVIADVTVANTLDALPQDCEWVVNCAAAGGGGAEEYRRLYLEGNRNLVERLSAVPPKKFVYTSSTAVYKQDDGSVVDETCPGLASAGTAGVLVETEHCILDAATNQGFPAVILRVAGIYGPGRGYWLRQYLAGTAVMEDDGSRRLNMIHRDDLVAAIMAALEYGKPGEVYNAVDDSPPTQREVYEWLSGRLGRPLPPVRSGRENPGRRGVTNKIVSNRKLRTELGWQPRYPSFKEGYEAELGRIHDHL